MTPGSETLSTAALAFSILLKLGFVVLLITICLRLLQRWQNGSIAGPHRQMAVLETTRLSPRQALHLVRVGEQVILVGATDQSLSCLMEVEGLEAENPAQAPAVPGFMPAGLKIPRQFPTLPEFAAQLKQTLARRRAPVEAQTLSNPSNPPLES